MITPQQVDSVVSVSQKLGTAVTDLYNFGLTVQKLVNNGWVVSSNIPGLTVTATITPADQTAILTQYTTLKNNLATIYATLP